MPLPGWTIFLATLGGLGRLRLAPGTWGALCGVVLMLGIGFVASMGWRMVWMAIPLFVGVPICGRAAEMLKKKDPSEVIWDEFATMPLVYLLVPQALLYRWDVLSIGFLLHRAFDIVKPPPLRWLENLKGGWGIMADDVGAAVYAGILLHFYVLKLPGA